MLLLVKKNISLWTVAIILTCFQVLAKSTPEGYGQHELAEQKKAQSARENFKGYTHKRMFYVKCFKASSKRMRRIILTTLQQV